MHDNVQQSICGFVVNYVGEFTFDYVKDTNAIEFGYFQNMQLCGSHQGQLDNTYNKRVNKHKKLIRLSTIPPSWQYPPTTPTLLYYFQGPLRFLWYSFCPTF